MSYRPLLLILPMALGCSERKAVGNGEIQPIAHIQLDTNRVVEVIGLRRWTAEMLQDSLARYAPTAGLESPNIAATLRDKLHFADATVHTSEQVFDESESTHLTLAVREPQDSARVHYAPQHLDSIARIAEWKSFTSLIAINDSGRRLAAVAGRHLEGLPRSVIDSSNGAHVTSQAGYAFESAEDSIAAGPMLDSLARRTSDHDLQTAIQAIDHSTSEPDRVVAVLILANFPKSDSAWRSLLKAAVGQQQATDAVLASQALDGLSERFARPIDWSSMATTIHDVLDGTALMALPAVANMLSRSGVTPANAKAFLAGGGEMLTAYMESADPELSEPAHRLLVALRGSDLGSDVDPWRAWIRTL